MKKLFTCLILSLFSLTQAFAVSGHITSNTTWTTNQIVTGDLYIDAGVTLTISAGVVVTFPFVDQNMDGIGDIDFIINGRLQVQGTPASKVYFKSNEAAPGKKDWGGIDYLTASTGELSVLSNVEILNAYEGILINGRNLTFNACRIADCYKSGLTIQSTIYTTTLNNSIIENCNGYGLLHQAGTIMINGLTILECGEYGFKALTGTDINAANLTVSNSGQEGMWIESTNTASFTNCKVVSSGLDGIRIKTDNPQFTNCFISNSGYTGVLVTGSSSSPTMSYCTIENNNGNGIYFDDGSTGNLSYCNINNNDKIGVVAVNNSIPNITSSNITNNNLDTTTIFVPSGTLYSFHDDGPSSKSALFSVRLPIIAGLTAIEITVHPFNYSSHPCVPSSGVEDEFGRVLSNVAIAPSSISTILNASTYGQIRTWSSFCNSSSQITRGNIKVNKIRQGGNRYKLGLATDNSTGLINAEYNYWGQVSGVNDRIYQRNPSTALFSNFLVSEILDAGCNLPNDVPIVDLINPSSLLIDPDSVTIRWTDQDLDDNASISLYCFKHSDTIGYLIQSNISEDDRADSMVWYLSTVPDGTYRIYAEISDGKDITRDTLWSALIQVGGLKASMPMDAFGVPGTYVEVPLRTLNTIAYYNIISYQFSIAYNSAILDATGIESTGTLSENWQVFANTSIPGQISVNGYSTTPLTTDGDLIKIVFLVNSNATNQSTSPLTFLDFTFNAGNPTQITENGLFTVKKQYQIAGHAGYYYNNNPVPNLKLSTTYNDAPLVAYSDSGGNYTFPWILSGNYTVLPYYNENIPPLVITPFDASITARYALSLHTLTNAQQEAADVDGNGLATVFDAALMAQYSVGLINSFTAGKWIIDPPSVSYTLVSNLGNQNYALSVVGDPSGNWAAPPSAIKKISISKPQDLKSQLIYIPIKAPETFYSYLLDVEYNPQKLIFVGVQKNKKLDNLQEVNNSSTGHIRIGAYGINPIFIDGTAMQLVFQASSNDPGELSITCLFDEKTGIITEIDENTSIGTYLGQNQPNPFSTNTLISFGTDKKQRLTIELFDLQGKLIKEISSGQYQPGSYSVWLNTDELGSGLYLYRMVTESGLLITRKLSVLK